VIISKVKSYLLFGSSEFYSSITKSGDKYFSPGENIIVSQKIGRIIILSLIWASTFNEFVLNILSSSTSTVPKFKFRFLKLLISIPKVLSLFGLFLLSLILNNQVSECNNTDYESYCMIVCEELPIFKYSLISKF